MVPIVTKGGFTEMSWTEDNGIDIGYFGDFDDQEKSLEKWKNRLRDMDDYDLLEFSVSQGTSLNGVTEHFPAYDVALKLKNNCWTPTEKQRNAIINVTAYYMAIELGEDISE
jgi:hypothetical protein